MTISLFDSIFDVVEGFEPIDSQLFEIFGQKIKSQTIHDLWDICAKWGIAVVSQINYFSFKKIDLKSQIICIVDRRGKLSMFIANNLPIQKKEATKAVCLQNGIILTIEDGLSGQEIVEAIKITDRMAEDFRFKVNGCRHIVPQKTKERNGKDYFFDVYKLQKERILANG